MSQTIPPLTLSNTLTDSIKTPPIHKQPSNSKSSNLVYIQPTPQHSPDPDPHPHHMVDQELGTDLIMDEEEKREISNKQSTRKKRASSHDSAGIVTLFTRSKTVASIFNLNRYDPLYDVLYNLKWSV